MLQIKAISLQYPGSSKYELNKVFLKIKAGEKICIIGESGSGKTTLLKAIDSQLDYEGNIEYNFEKLKKRSETLVAGVEDIKLIDQSFQLHKHITVLENLEFYLRPYKERFRKVRISKLTKAFKLEKFLHKKVEHISGGEKQRVAIANALTSIPDVLLLDEPFNNLDYNLRARAMEFLDEEISEYNTTAILVSHRPDEVLSFADRIVVMRKGKIIQSGNPDDVFKKPKREYTAGLLGEYNLLKENIHNTHQLNDKSFIRPIHLETCHSNEDVIAEVLECIFIGDKYRIICSENLVFYQNKPIEVGKTVKLKVNSVRSAVL